MVAVLLGGGALQPPASPLSRLSRYSAAWSRVAILMADMAGATVVVCRVPPRRDD
jgi:hypothetical protein